MTKQVLGAIGLLAIAAFAVQCVPCLVPEPGPGQQKPDAGEKITASCRTLQPSPSPVPPPPPPAPAPAPAPREPTPYELSKRALLQSRSDGGISSGVLMQPVVGAGAALTGAFVLQGLNGLLTDVDRLMKSATGDAQVLLGTLKADVGNTITQLQNVLGDDVNSTLDKLNEMQREFVEHVDSMIPQIQRSILDVESHVAQDVIKTLREADIVVYDVLYSLPFRPQLPRVVYWEPASYRNDGQDVLVALHGNFLNVRTPRLKLDGVAVTPAGASANITQVRIAAPPGDGPTTNVLHKIDLEYTGCEPTTCFPWEQCQPKLTAAPSSATITMLPKMRYGVKAMIQPLGRQRSHTSQTFTFWYRDENCAADFRSTATYCLPAGWTVDSVPTPSVTSSNCGSSITSTTMSGSNCIKVDYHIVGCGYAPIIHDCNGRGWLGFNVTVSGWRNDTATFPAQTFEEVSSTKSSYSFRYTQTLPPESTVDSWSWTASVKPISGSPFDLSTAVQSTSQGRAAFANNVLTVSVFQ